MLELEHQKKLQKILLDMETMAFEPTNGKTEHACWSLGISELTKLTEHGLKRYCLKCSTDNCFTRLS
ncbi:MAG: hypothetical protein ACFFD4_10890 [Candidatus Odinarchaeota archaeon]